MFLAVTFLMTWGSYALYYFEIVPPLAYVVLWVVGAVGPTVGAAAATLIVLGRKFPGLDLDPQFGKWRLYLLALGVPVGIAIVAGVVTELADPDGAGIGSLPFDVVEMMKWLVGLAVLEEIGWRGFLNPILARRGRLVASGITGVIWGAWHFPWLIAEYHASAVDLTLFTTMTVLGSVALSVLTTRSRSLGPATLAHASWNFAVASGIFFGISEESMVYTVTLAVLTAIVAAVSMYFADRRKLPSGVPSTSAATALRKPRLSGASS